MNTTRISRTVFFRPAVFGNSITFSCAPAGNASLHRCYVPTTSSLCRLAAVLERIRGVTPSLIVIPGNVVCGYHVPQGTHIQHRK